MTLEIKGSVEEIRIDFYMCHFMTICSNGRALNMRNSMLLGGFLCKRKKKYLLKIQLQKSILHEIIFGRGNFVNDFLDLMGLWGGI